MNFHHLSRLMATTAASVSMLAILGAPTFAQEPAPESAQPAAAQPTAAPTAPQAAPASAPAATTTASQAVAAAPAPTAVVSQTTPTATVPAQATAQPQPAAVTGFGAALSAADIQGLHVFGSEGRQVGKVVRVNQVDGSLKSIDVQSNGYFGFFKKTYEVPFSAVKKNGAKIELSMTSQEAMRKLK